METEQDLSSPQEDLQDPAIIRTSIEDVEESQRIPVSSSEDPGNITSDYEPSVTPSEASSPAGSQYTPPLKRPAGEPVDASLVPFKRKRTAFNSDYLTLLNQEIEDAATGAPIDQALGLQPSQLGMVKWSSEEKEAFFRALARVGSQNVREVVTSVASKSEVEILQYLDLLRTFTAQRRKDLKYRPEMVLADYPAAMEISQQCCYAQEEAADELSVRVERKEQIREENNWGRYWNITPRLAAKLDRQRGEADAAEDRQNLKSASESELVQRRPERAESADEAQRPVDDETLRGDNIAPLLNMSQWLRLSRDVFMNSSVPISNWHSLDVHPPSVWASTFDDFQSLTVSITQRLVQASLFFAMSRLRSQAVVGYEKANHVTSQDVEAAVDSLRMPLNSRNFWQHAARRLRLDVYEEDESDEDDVSSPPRMTYDEVEQRLADEDSGALHDSHRDRVTSSNEPESEHSSSLLESSDDAQEDTDTDASYATSADDEAEDAQYVEALEILQHSATEFPIVRRVKDALMSRIANEWQQEEDAENLDAHASYREEVRLWQLLKQAPPMQIPKVPEPSVPSRSTRDVEGVFSMGRNWRDGLDYFAEWETDHPTT